MPRSRAWRIWTRLEMMMLLALVCVPLAAGLAAMALPSERYRPLLVPLAAIAHIFLVVRCLRSGASTEHGAWIGIDPLGALFLLAISAFFLICAIYAPGYLRLRPERGNRVFTACLLLFLSAASLVSISQHLGLIWVAIEATTLATAPLIYFNRNPRSIDATWNYLLVCSVGIALALLGSLFLAYSAHLAGRESSLFFVGLLAEASHLSRPWLRAGFVLLLIGYGTKMGLAPLHTWKPAAYAEAPGLVGALLSCGVTSCAFLALLRSYRVLVAAGEGAFGRNLLLIMGVLSIGWAAAFMVRQRDFKRVLAYSSVEHMGILLLGVGIGAAGVWGALLHLITNGLAKITLFLTAGNIHRAYGSKMTDDVRGAMGRVPLSASLFLAAFFAITGSPPGGPFVSQFTILTAAIDAGAYGWAATFLGLLIVAFIGMGATVLSVVTGAPTPGSAATPFRDRVAHVLAPAVALALLLLIGIRMPEWLGTMLAHAAAELQQGVTR